MGHGVVTVASAAAPTASCRMLEVGRGEPSSAQPPVGRVPPQVIPCVQSAFITPLEARRGEAVAVVAAVRNLLITPTCRDQTAGNTAGRDETGREGGKDRAITGEMREEEREEMKGDRTRRGRKRQGYNK